MKKNLLLPDYLFEISWEVCNKVGGIYTVVSTKARTISEMENLTAVYIGPDLWKEKENPLFTEDKRLWSAWRKKVCDDKLTVRCGYWEIPGRPKVVLVDYTGYMEDKDAIYGELWMDYGVDSLHGYGDYDDSMIFGYAVGKVIESFYNTNIKKGSNVVVQAHEWQSGNAALYVKKHLPAVGTIFTTHATSIGRSIASNGKPLYDYFEGYNGDQMAAELNVQSKQSVEKITAANIDCFTTVSELTARECKQLLERECDVILENGFEKDFVPTGKAFDAKRKVARDARLRVARALTGDTVSDDALIIGIGGRMEMRNKGIDMFLETMARLNACGLERDVVAFVDVPAWSGDAREDLVKRLRSDKQSWETPLPNPYMTHNLNNFYDDAIACTIRNLQIDNRTGKNRVKVIYVPCYLKGNDGIFDMEYYDVLIGNDLSVYPSYYEPWGYTPLESVAFKVPTITTDLAGFGLWANTLKGGKYSEIEDGVKVIHRSDYNYSEVADVIRDTIVEFSAKSDTEVKKIRKNAASVAEKALWKHFIRYYYEAYDIALCNAQKRNSQA